VLSGNSPHEEIDTKKIGKYEILRELGRGAMGVVFKARDPLIGRLVALKTIALAASQSDDLRQRFYREAQAAGGLQHPNIVTVYEMGEAEGVPFIAMEYLEGESLDAALQRDPQIPLAQKLGYFVQVCRALSYAHQHGIVHRDIKPGNIVVTRDGTVKVVDFGIARMVDTSKTQTGVLLGTLAYMSPQLVKGERADERSDIWAVGVLCYELLTGQKPFEGENHAALLLSIISDQPRPIAYVVHDCPEEVRIVIEKMLIKNVQERYQSFEEVLRSLEPVWRKSQRESVDSMLGQSRELIREGEMPAARSILLRARLIDGTRSISRQMLEEVNAAMKDKLLPIEVEERLERARTLRSEGLLEDACAAAKSALDLDSKSESARRMIEEIAQQMKLLQETEKSQRTPALGRLLMAMRSAIQQENPSEAIRLGREALGRAGHDGQVSELLELAERKLVERSSGGAAGVKPPSGPAGLRGVEIPLYAESGVNEELIREYVFERIGPEKKKSEASSPVVGARAIGSTRRSVDSAPQSGPATLQISTEGAAREQTLQRSGTLVLPQAATASAKRAWWKRPMIYLSLVAVAAGAVVAAMGWKRSRVPAAAVQTAAAQSNIPSAEDRQKQLIAEAHEAADRNDYATAQSKLDEAAKFVGPSLTRIEELRQRFRDEVQNDAVRGIALQESELWTQGTRLLGQNQFADAEKSFRQILALPPGGRRRADAQRMLDSVIPMEKEDEQLFTQAQQLARNTDPGNLRQAQHLLDRVIADNSHRRAEAERLRSGLLPRLSKNDQELQRNQQLSNLETAARRDLDGGDTGAARNKLAEIRKLGDDDKKLDAEIVRSERTRFAALESQFQQDVQSADEPACANLMDLQRQFRALAGSGGPVADSARNYAENLIPAKITEIGGKIASARSNAAENQAFDNAVSDYKRFLEARDANSLKSNVLPKFQAIADGGGTHATDAGQYVHVLIPTAIQQLAPHPVIGCAEVPATLRPSVRAGDLVACGLLDSPRLQWSQFTWPEFPPRARQAGQTKGVAMLTLTVDENGNVVDAKPRGPRDVYGFDEAVIAAARQWKTNPPRVQGKPVRTEFSVDIPFGK
jgi:TonB family protein